MKEHKPVNEFGYSSNFDICESCGQAIVYARKDQKFHRYERLDMASVKIIREECKGEKDER